MAISVSGVADFLNNATVGAVIGAVVTYVIVRHSDKARAVNAARDIIPRHLVSAASTARQRLQSIRDRGVAPAGMVPIVIGASFDTDGLSRAITDAYGHLSLRQRQALSKLMLYMTQADEINERMRRAAAASREGAVADAPAIEVFFRDQTMLLEQAERFTNAYRNGTLNEDGSPVA